MKKNILTQSGPISIHPYFVGNRILTKALPKASILNYGPIIVGAGQSGLAVIFRYGVLVFFGTSEDEEKLFIKSNQEILVDPVETPERGEGAFLVIDSKRKDGLDADTIYISKREYERIQVIAETLARSLILDIYEAQVEKTFDHIEPITDELKGRGPRGRSAKKLMRHIGETLSIQRKMIGHVEVEGKPDVLWDRSDLEKLYFTLEDEYEISERHQALKHKLELIHQTAETMLSILGERRTLHVEWYIVILILFDIVFSLWEKYILHGAV